MLYSFENEGFIILNCIMYYSALYIRMVCMCISNEYRILMWCTFHCGTWLSILCVDRTITKLQVQKLIIIVQSRVGLAIRPIWVPDDNVSIHQKHMQYGVYKPIVMCHVSLQRKFMRLNVTYVRRTYIYIESNILLYIHIEYIYRYIYSVIIM